MFWLKITPQNALKAVANRVVLTCHRLLLKTKRHIIQIKIVGVGTEIEIITTGLGSKRSIFLLLYSDIQCMCRESDPRATAIQYSCHFQL